MARPHPSNNAAQLHQFSSQTGLKVLPRAAILPRVLLPAASLPKALLPTTLHPRALLRVVLLLKALLRVASPHKVPVPSNVAMAQVLPATLTTTDPISNLDTRLHVTAHNRTLDTTHASSNGVHFLSFFFLLDTEPIHFLSHNSCANTRFLNPWFRRIGEPKG